MSGLLGAGMGDPIDEALTRDAVVSELFGSRPARAQIGRYQLLRRRGSGGAGVVYEAIDPHLDRRVAVKLLWGSLRGESREAAQSRLLREARALALIRHPNVVEVYDLGVYHGLALPAGSDRPHEAGVYLVMELIDGIDGSRWLAEQTRSVARIADVFVGAGRGLAAAHEVGLVHRDFKPANVLVGDDGRARVVDFGLARRPRGSSAGSSDDSSSATPRPRTDPEGVYATFDRDLTGFGNVVGTPRYMAPEQLAGELVDMRSDQYAFCTSVFYALYGRPPFSAPTFRELAKLKRAGKLDPPPATPDVPAAVFSVLRRGLDPDPARRYPSMHATIAALERALGHRRRRTIAVAGALAAGLLVVSTAAASTATETAPCARAADRVDALWNDDAEASLRTAFARAEPRFGPDAAERTATTIDARVAAWRDRWDATCGAGPQTAAADRQRACLVQQVDAMQAIVGRLAAADPETVRTAHTIADRFPRANACDADVGVAASAASEAIRLRLADAVAVGDDRRIDEAVATMTTLLAEADALGDRGLVAGILIERSKVAETAGRGAAAASDAEAAYHAALDAETPALAFEGARRVALALAADMRTADEAGAWLRRAEAILPQLEDAEPPRRGLLRARARLAFASGQYAMAAAHMAAALDGAPEDLELAAALGNYSATLSRAGELDQALAQATRAVAILERELGPGHPAVIDGLDSRASALRRLGRHDEAIDALQRAIAIAGNGERDASTRIHVMLALAINYDDVGRLEEAEAVYREVLALARAGAYGSDSREMGAIHQDLGVNLLMQERTDDAREHFERARAIWEGALGAEHPEVARVWRMLGEVRTAAGELDEAIAAFARCLQILEATVGPDHPRVVSLLFRTALVHLAREDLPAAQTAARQAARVARKVMPAEHPHLARAQILEILAGLAPPDADPLAQLDQEVTHLPADLDREFIGYARLAAAKVHLAREERQAAATAAAEAIDHLEHAGVGAAQGLALARRLAADL